MAKGEMTQEELLRQALACMKNARGTRSGGRRRSGMDTPAGCTSMRGRGTGRRRRRYGTPPNTRNSRPLNRLPRPALIYARCRASSSWLRTRGSPSTRRPGISSGSRPISRYRSYYFGRRLHRAAKKQGRTIRVMVRLQGGRLPAWRRHRPGHCEADGGHLSAERVGRARASVRTRFSAATTLAAVCSSSTWAHSLAPSPRGSSRRSRRARSS